MKRWGVPALLLACAGPAAGQERAGVQRTGEGVVLDFQGAELRVVIGALAQLAGLNVIYSNLPPNRTVTVRTPGPVSQAVVRQYLESLVESNDLEMVTEGEVVRISGRGAPAPDPRAAAPPVRPAARTSVPADVPRLYVYRLRHAQAEGLAGTLAALFGAGGAGAGGRDRPLSLSEELRQQQALSFQAAATGAQAAAPEPGAGGGMATGLLGPVHIVPDLRANSLLIRAVPADYETIRAAIEELDTRPLQVLIEVLIAEVRRTRQSNLGISATVPDQRDSETGALFGGSLAGASAGDVALRIQGLGAIRADIVLSALAASSDVTILSRPVILAQNNQRARILVGDQRPFIQLFRALPTEAAVRDQVVQYRSVGTQLTIRPTINADGYVSLTLLQEVSTATAETQFGAPVISTREAETQLLVKDGHTVVIGGLLDEQEDHTESGIPILKDIPLIGSLFRSTTDRKVVTELFLILTPHVIRSDAELDETTRKLQESTRNLKDRLPDPIPLFLPGAIPGRTLPDTLRPALPDTASPPARDTIPARP